MCTRLKGEKQNMKNKILLLMSLLVAGCIMMIPQSAKADVSSSAQNLNVVVSSAAAGDLTPSPTTITLTSQHFTWDGTAATSDATPIRFGDPTSNVSFLITNDIPTVQDEVVTVTVAHDAGTDATSAQFLAGGRDLQIIGTDGTYNADITLNVDNYAGSGAPTIGGTILTTAANGATISTATTVAGTPMSASGQKFPLSLSLDVDQTTLTEADGPLNLGFTLTFTLASITP